MFYLDDPNVDVNVETTTITSLENVITKEPEKKEENKVMYRGKLRKLFSCQVEGCLYKTLLRKDIERHSRVHTGLNSYFFILHKVLVKNKNYIIC